jgi:hypothetical protein
MPANEATASLHESPTTAEAKGVSTLLHRSLRRFTPTVTTVSLAECSSALLFIFGGSSGGSRLWIVSMSGGSLQINSVVDSIIRKPCWAPQSSLGSGSRRNDSYAKAWKRRNAPLEGGRLFLSFEGNQCADTLPGGQPGERLERWTIRAWAGRTLRATTKEFVGRRR